MAIERIFISIPVLVSMASGCNVGEAADADTEDPSGDETRGAPTSEAEGEGDALEPALADAWQQARFEAEVQPILDAHCAGCHGPVAAQVGLVLGPSAELSSAEILRGLVEREAVAAPLALIEPGAPQDSWLLRKVLGDFEGIACNGGCGGPMPPAGEPVTDEQRQVLTEWITAMESNP